MKCDKCKEEIVGIHLLKRRIRRDLVLCQNCYIKKKFVRKKIFRSRRKNKKGKGPNK